MIYDTITLSSVVFSHTLYFSLFSCAEGTSQVDDFRVSSVSSGKAHNKLMGIAGIRYVFRKPPVTASASSTSAVPAPDAHPSTGSMTGALS